MANPQHYTLVASTVKTFDLDDDYKEVEVLNVDGTAAIYFTVNGTTPVLTSGVGQDGTHVLPAAIGSLQVPCQMDDTPNIKVISSGTPKVSVRGVY